MNENNAGSATGIDLAALEQLARAATPGPWMRLFGERTVYDRMEDGCRGNAIARADVAFSSQDADNLDFIAASNPAAVLALIALARATPQHPADPSHVDGYRETLRECAALLDMDDDEDLLDVPQALKRALADAATPQHSVTEQAQPVLTVWYGPMPESNGKSNFTAVLMRKDAGWDGPHVTIERGEYPDRIRYEADRVRHLIGEISEEPDILAYDADKHSGYVKPNYAQPLASTAATQPEQALRKLCDQLDGMRRTMFLRPGTGQNYSYLVHEDVAAYVEQARAALSIPALTAPTQQENDQANVLPPTRGTDSQHSASCAADEQWIFDLAVEHETRGNGLWGPITFSSTGIVEFGRAIEAEVTRRFRAQGGSTNNDSAPASTAASEQQASVSEASERDRKLEEAAARCVAANVEFEAWSLTHGGLPLDKAGSAMSTDDGLALPTYKFGRTEIAWRAWANALSGRATIPSEADERAPVDDSLRRQIIDDTNATLQEQSATMLAQLKKIQALEAALTHRATTAAPGYKLVPIEPTDDMCRAAREKMGVGANYADHIYRAMLAAAPDIATTAADQQGDTESAMQVGCERDDGLLNIHAEGDTCEVCAPAIRSNP